MTVKKRVFNVVGGIGIDADSIVLPLQSGVLGSTAEWRL
jgi:hypothetical protein